MESKGIYHEEILICLFNYFPTENKELNIPTDRQIIQSNFYKLSKQFPDIFKEFAFNKNKLFPTCSSLDEAISTLLYCDLIKFSHILSKDYVLNLELIRDYFNDNLKEKLDWNLTEKFKLASNELYQSLNLH